MNRRGLVCIAFFFHALSVPMRGDDLSALLKTIQSADKDGAGSEAVREARDKIVTLGAAAISDVIAALDTPNAVAANWLITTLNTIVERDLKSGGKNLNAGRLTAIITNTRLGGLPRRYAMQVLAKIAPDKSKGLIAGMLNDAEFRRDAVEAKLAEGDAANKAGDKASAQKTFEVAFDSARDLDQVRLAATRLRSFKIKKDAIEHLGFLTDWYVVGPWPATNKTGFAMVLPPEQKVDLKATYEGAKGPIAWKRFKSADAQGVVNLLTAAGQMNDAVAYAYTTVDVPREMQAELRGAGNDTITVWLNGTRVIADPDYMDRRKYDGNSAKVMLRPGANTFLAKVCQGQPIPNKDSNAWDFQLRICDATGKGIGVTSSLPPEPPAQAKQ
jgi:hypothetical protein